MSKKKCKCECPAGEKWAVPYADFLSLLLALFIALYALASANVEKQKALKEEFVKIYNFSANDTLKEQEKLEKSMTDDPSQELEEGRKIILHTLENQTDTQQNKSDGANLIELPNGSLLSVPAHLNFETGKADINSVFASEFLAKLAELINAMPPETEINVKGYAEDKEVRSSRYKDALDLASARANNVIRELIRLNISASRLYSTSYGSNQSSNLKDKRVVIFELKTSGEAIKEEDLDLETIFNRMKEE